MGIAMTNRDFSFAEHAPTFEAHIHNSIPSDDRRRWWMLKLGRCYVQPGTRVIDVGCSTGADLVSIRDDIQPSRPDVDYIGIDLENGFAPQWREREAPNLKFEVCDALKFNRFNNMSLALSSFALQFIPERHKIGLLQRVHDGLVEGGALLIAEKSLAASAAIQDAVTFGYYDHKRERFTAAEILDKEASLRGFMRPWTKAQLTAALLSVGFVEIDTFWQDGPFVGIVAVKRDPAYRARAGP